MLCRAHISTQAKRRALFRVSSVRINLLPRGDSFRGASVRNGRWFRFPGESSSCPIGLKEKSNRYEKDGEFGLEGTGRNFKSEATVAGCPSVAIVGPAGILGIPQREMEVHHWDTFWNQGAMARIRAPNCSDAVTSYDTRIYTRHGWTTIDAVYLPTVIEVVYRRCNFFQTKNPVQNTCLCCYKVKCLRHDASSFRVK